MRTPKTYYVIATLAVAVTASAALVARAERRMEPVSTTIKGKVADLKAAVERETASGCIEDDGRGGTVACGDAKARIDAMHDDAARAHDDATARPADLRHGAVAAIRAFRKDAQLAPAYRSTSPNPYRDDGRTIEIYVDAHGNEYWVDPADDALVQVGPGAGMHSAARKTRPEARLAVPELRARATAVVETQLADFAARRSSLHPLEDHKDRELYFFRWDDFSQPAKESELPPFVQVGIRADGTVVSFTNTLSR